MFRLTKTYRGRDAIKIENIDHDHVTDLIFGELLPQMAADPSWSFSVERI